ncbi:hypothetical protein [Alkalimarinus sediminis]|uniref:LPP20 lipoprotein n=1 Tax=Alkalimarinus sediminis TaxID=1632866 RepID=A0A9E8KQM1_9ALTE|nr:hypothetical protein [Alkalimarinus sediminis]UZW76598.1 hypothetical protein NNL22_08455 [Alkalimarinus sediminis]
MNKQTTIKSIKLVTNTTLLTTVMGFVAGCSTTSEAPDPMLGLNVEPCVFESTTKEAPEWVCSGYLEGKFTATGMFPPSPASRNLRFNTAVQRARTELARKLNVTLTGALEDYERTTGQGKNATVDLVVENLSQSKTQVSLNGTRTYTSVTGPDGSLYVLVGMDEEIAARNINKIVQSSYRNQEAQWQSAEADKAFDEIKREIEERVYQGGGRE